MSQDNSAALQTIDQWVAQLRGLQPHLDSEGPKAIAEVVQQHLEAAAAAGEMLGGTKWPARVKDGQRALPNAAKYLSVRVHGTTVIAELTGPMAISQFGTGRQVARPLWPMGGLPFKLGDAIRLGIVRMSEEFMNRRGGHGKRGRR
jgi:hypothetical protein